MPFRSCAGRAGVVNFTALRKLLFQLHVWIGLGLGLLLAALGLSGSLLVYDDVLTKFLAPRPRVTAHGAPLPLDAILAAVRTQVHWRGGATITPSGDAGEPAIVRIGAAGRGSPRTGVSQYYADPVSGAVLGSGVASRPPILAFAHQLHGNFLMGQDGRRFVGWLGLAMLVLGISGLVLWWPRKGQWRNAFIVRRNARGLRFHRELHGMFGVWAFGVFLLVSFSGLALAWPQLMGMPNQGANVRAVPKVAPLRDARPIGADRAVAVVRAAAPDMTLRSVTMPAQPGQAITVSYLSHGAVNATAYVDPLRATILELRDPSANVMAWQRPLHRGALGPVWRFLVFLCGLLPSVFVVTGMAMWWKKRQNRLTIKQPISKTSSLACRPGRA